MKSNLPDRRDMLLPISLWERMASAASQVRACRGAATIRYVVHPCDTTPPLIRPSGTFSQREKGFCHTLLSLTR